MPVAYVIDPEAEWLPRDRKIIERGFVRYKPFGVGSDGKRIDDISGKALHSVVDHLADTVSEHYLASHPGDTITARKMGERAVQRLVDALNGCVSGPEFHVEADFLRNEWNSYSYEYYHFAMEFAKEIAQDSSLIFTRGPKTIPSALVAILRPLSIQQIFQVTPRLATRFVKFANLELVSSTPTSARIRMRIDPRNEAMTGKYALACRQNACESYKGTLASVPWRMMGLPWAEVADVACLSNGDAYCEWLFTWRNPAPRAHVGLLVGLLLAAAVIAALILLDVGVVLALAFGAAVVAHGILWDRWRWTRHELDEKERVLLRQGEEFQEHYEALEVAHEKVQVLSMDLERVVEERTRELRAANEQLEKLAITDELTRLANRRHFYERLREEMNRSQRYGHPLSLLMVDVDHFKRYNDEHGHLRGDRVLRAIAEILQRETRAGDVVARYGGEEFAVILPDTDARGAADVARKLQHVVEAATGTDDDPTLLDGVTVSIGVALCEDPKGAPEPFIVAADDALYAAKRAGRNRVEMAKTGSRAERG